MFSGVLVCEVEGISRELNASAGVALDEEGIVVSCRVKSLSTLPESRIGCLNLRTTSQMRSPETFEGEDMVRVAVFIECSSCELCARNCSNVSCAAQFRSRLGEIGESNFSFAA